MSIHMSDVRIKKSVLQSIIKKSLKESGPKGTGDVSRRLTVGPETSSLPAGLPLSPSDRMSTQLDVERPPVEDPEYVPSNSKELGFALQALAEMVPNDQVEQAYTEFQQVIEKLEAEASEDKDMQIESLRRKNAKLAARLREAEGLDDEDDEDDKLTPEEEAELAAIERQEATGPDAMYFKYERVLRAYGLSKTNFMDMHRLVRTRELTEGDLEDFLELLGSLQNDPEIVAKVSSRLRNPAANDDALLRFISRFKDNYEERVAREAAVAADKAQPKFEYQTAAKPYGYAAASGLRQSFIRDVLGVRALNAFIAPRRIQRYVYNSIREAFNDAFELPENQEFLKTLFDEEGLEEYKSVMQDQAALNHSTLFQNFAGAVTYEALASIAELNFKPHRGQPGRQIGKAFMTEFGDENKKLQSHEEDQLEQMAQRGEYADFVNDILDTSEENGHRGLLAAAAAMTADDADKEEYGSYASPAFSTMKKASSVAKPPELHVADYAGKDDPMVGQIKAADRAARKAARK
jgi:hypothetical protein